MEAGKQVARYAAANNLTVNISKTPYCKVDGWQFAGSLFGLAPRVGKPERIGDGKIYVLWAEQMVTKYGKTFMDEVPVYISTQMWTEDEYRFLHANNKLVRQLVKEHWEYECSTEIYRIDTKEVMTSGHATCSNMELNKLDFAGYAVHSMSQTRSIGKGFRSLLGYVMKSAGFESTPAEEMDQQMHAEKHKEEVKAAASAKSGMSEDQILTTIEHLKTGKVTREVVEKYYTLDDKTRARLFPEAAPAVPEPVKEEPAPQPAAEQKPAKPVRQRTNPNKK